MTRKTRLIALIVSVVMLIGMLPLSLFAEDSAVVAEATAESTVTLKGVSATLGAETALNYYIAADEVVANGLTANFTVGDKKESVKLSDVEKTADGVKVSIGLSAIELATKVTFTLTDADGAAVEFATVGGAVSSYEYSVKEYVLDLIASDNTDEAKEAAKALLLYGYFAETYFADAASTSFDGTLTADDIAAVSGGAFGAGNATVNNALVGNPDVLGKVKLVLDSYAKIRIEVKGDTAPEVASGDAEVKVVNIDGKYYVDVLGIKVSDFNTAYSFTVNGTAVSVSLLAVAGLVGDDAATYGDAFANLAKALYNYYDSTNDYKIAESCKIVYNVNGGTLPENAPKSYDPAVGVLLPTDVTRDGYVFGGWYANADFSGERVYYVAAGASGAVTVYAKWYRNTIDEDYSTITINAASGKYNNINYNNSKNMLYKTVTVNGNTYLAVNLNAGAGVSGEGSITVKDYGYISNPVVCYEMRFMKMKDVPLPTHIKLQLPVLLNGSMPTVFTSDDTGAFRLTGSDVVIGTIKEDIFTTLRIAVDFSAKTVTAYDENYAVIDSVVINALPTFEQIDRQYHMFLHFRKNQNTHPDLAETGVIVDNIKIVEGNIFEKPVTELPAPNEIVYDAGMGILPENAPTTYNSDVDTMLPILSKDGYIFKGWYTSSTFANNTRIEKIAAGTKGTVQVYAKWLTVVTNENYTGDDFSYKNGTHGQPQYQGVYYNVSNSGTYMKTVVDPVTGNTYLRVDNTTNNKNGVIRVTDDTAKLGIAGFDESFISYEFSFSKIEGVALSNINLSLQSSGGAGGNGSVSILTSDTSGKVYLRGGSVCLGTISEGAFTKIKIGVDFATGILYAFDGENAVIDSVVLTAPSGFASLAEWQRASNGLKHHILFLSIENKASSGTATGLLVDDIKIVDGNAFN